MCVYVENFLVFVVAVVFLVLLVRRRSVVVVVDAPRRVTVASAAWVFGRLAWCSDWLDVWCSGLTDLSSPRHDGRSPDWRRQSGLRGARLSEGIYSEGLRARSGTVHGDLATLTTSASIARTDAYVFLQLDPLGQRSACGAIPSPCASIRGGLRSGSTGSRRAGSPTSAVALIVTSTRRVLVPEREHRNGRESG